MDKRRVVGCSGVIAASALSAVLSELGHITMITGDQSVDAAELSTANFL